MNYRSEQKINFSLLNFISNFEKFQFYLKWMRNTGNYIII